MLKQIFISIFYIIKINLISLYFTEKKDDTERLRLQPSTITARAALTPQVSDGMTRSDTESYNNNNNNNNNNDKLIILIILVI